MRISQAHISSFITINWIMLLTLKASFSAFWYADSCNRPSAIHSLMDDVMTEHTAVPLSVLDLSPIPQAKARDAFHCSLDLAQHAERWGYRRYWLAEHHNMTGIGSAATSVLLGYLAAGTQSIRLGSGGDDAEPCAAGDRRAVRHAGVALPRAHRFGVGPRARHRSAHHDGAASPPVRRWDTFPRDVQELQNYFCDAQPGQPVQAVPGQGCTCRSGCSVPASTARSWRRSSACRSPSPRTSPRICWFQALQLYRENFKPSKQLAQPHAMVCVNVIAAESDSDARPVQLDAAAVHQSAPWFARPAAAASG